AAFGGEIKEEDIPRWRSVFDLDRLIWAFDGELPVATAAAHTFQLTVPGGELPAAGVTFVGVLPSHRRRGILRQLMRHQLDDVRGRGEPLAILWASEAPIYGRFGYGLAARAMFMDAERSSVSFRAPSRPTGSVRLVPLEEAGGVLPDIYDRVRRETPGMFGRTEAWWSALRLADPEHERRGGGPLFCSVIDLDGSPEAYALYRLEGSWEGGIPRGKLQIREALGTTPEATREIWRFLFGVDLVERVKGWALPVDHPLQLMLADTRRLHLTVGDGLWLRLVDLPAALRARSYAEHASLVLGVDDAFCEWNTGTWRLDVAAAGAEVTRANGEPDLRLTIEDLASTYLGAFTFADLARAGRVEETTEGAIARADELFRTSRAPWCPEVF
ncbi:MAG: GNAT family N-acetyltransferase, partial [Actinobacteria bacterium]|nr:GNAT family N-acetyltransferase [Actinomycetota bacterium]